MSFAKDIDIKSIIIEPVNHEEMNEIIKNRTWQSIDKNFNTREWLVYQSWNNNNLLSSRIEFLW